MDYLRIYNELIEHRKMMPKVEGIYYERHHILPRCMGGRDEEENLVYLTAREHFVVHLLLALVHGGKLWYAALAMQMPAGGLRIINSRQFELVRRHTALLISQAKSDQTVYKIRDVNTGEVFEATQSDLYKIHGLNKSGAHQLVAGKIEVSKNLCMESSSAFELKRNKIHRFKNIQDGSVFEMTANNLAKTYGLKDSSVRAMVTGHAKSCDIFCLESTDCGTLKTPKNAIFIFENTEDGKILEGNSLELQAVFNCNQTTLMRLRHGKKTTIKNYKFLSWKMPRTCGA